MKAIVYSLFLLTGTAYAQTGVIGKVKGSKAIVDFQNIQVKPGDVITVQKGPVQKDSLRKREHVLIWRFLYGYTDAEVSPSSASTSDVETMEVDFGYGYNFERFELGGSLSRSTKEDDSSKTTTMTLTVYGQLNFIKNNSEADFVPYIRAGVGSFTAKYNSDSEGSFKMSGAPLTAQLGFLWFPFSEIFSLDAGLLYEVVDSDTDTTPKVKYKTKSKGAYAGWSLYF